MEDVLDEIANGRRDRATELGEFYYGSGDVVGLKTLVTDLGEIDAKEMATFPIGTPDDGINLRVGRYGPYVEGPGEADGDGAPVSGKRPRRPAARRADRGQGQGAARQPGRRGAGGRQPPRHGSPDRREERPIRALRHRAAARRRPQVRQAAHRLALQVDDPRHGEPRAGGPAARPAAHRRHRRRRHRDHRAERSLRALPQEGHRLALAHQRGPDLRHHPRPGARRSTPSPSSAVAARPPRRSRSSATTPSPASRSS